MNKKWKGIGNRSHSPLRHGSRHDGGQQARLGDLSEQERVDRMDAIHTGKCDTNGKLKSVTDAHFEVQ